MRSRILVYEILNIINLNKVLWSLWFNCKEYFRFFIGSNVFFCDNVVVFIREYYFLEILDLVDLE